MNHNIIEKVADKRTRDVFLPIREKVRRLEVGRLAEIFEEEALPSDMIVEICSLYLEDPSLYDRVGTGRMVNDLIIRAGSIEV